MSVQYVAASSASTSKGYVQVPQFQVMTVASSSAPTTTTNTKGNAKRSSKNNKNNVDNGAESSSQQQHIQLIAMDQNALMDNCSNQYVMQIPQNQIQMVSNGTVPMQLMNLPEGAAFVPINSYNGQSNQSTVFQTSDGQQIQFVIAGDGMYNQDPGAVATVALSSVPEEQNHKSVEDAISYVNPKQYARIFQRRGARAKLEMEGRISKQRRTYLHESRHKHAMKRVRGTGGKFDSNTQGPDGASSTCSSPTSSLGKANSSVSFDSQTPVKAETSPPPPKRTHQEAHQN